MKSCSFCDKSARQVKRLVERYDVANGPAICDECVSGAIAVMQYRALNGLRAARVTNNISLTLNETPARFDEEKPPTPAASRCEPESDE